ncbi:DUF2288 domain-containing protein [Spiribacter vilamensis]|uniref:DUF2288 domain-containing protein n=1 Tax=Spiribacter vilamensis TaxID=531306 RepID=A0A4Q8D1F0_9GAMM|nr:DUF2288 domain-containing protein [Spiribacter vilamensis]RZU99158.1 hypothetical protein EV698_1438 [Spiribacter vilamensis]TVO61851.1 DUF2288 domain-containing protein [Spiribacter vilamensis]
MTDAEIPLETQLNTETGRVRWSELERHFARGVVVRVDAGIDLVAVAAAFVRDDEATVMEWMTAGQVRRAEAEDARDWVSRDPDLWAVVAAPWVLVQEPVAA